jgi:Cu+-exporting ATPase
MHREYHGDEWHIDHDHPGPVARPARPPIEPGLVATTIAMGLLIGLDVVGRVLDSSAARAPFGVSLIWLAAIVGTARITYLVLESLRAGRIGADVALAQAALAALVLREPFVAAEVVFIALVGEVLEAIAAARAYRSLNRLFDQAPRTARVRRDGETVELPIDQVTPGAIVLVAPGERVPVDGRVVAGRSSVDQSTLTGEPIPADVGPGDAVFTGTLNQFGQLECRAERVGAESTWGQVVRLVAEAQRRKAPIQRTADRYARWFLPIVEGVAWLTLIAGWWLGWPDTWQRAVAVLVVACPCALVLATPAAVLAATSRLARMGVVLKGGIALERLAACDTLAFDKTGTLTLGQPQVGSSWVAEGFAGDDLRALSAAVERASRHPLAEAVVRWADEHGTPTLEARDAVAQPGAGIVANVRDQAERSRAVVVGNPRLLSESGIALDEAATEALRAIEERGETPILVAVEGAVAGVIGLHDPARPEAHDVVHDLKHLGFREIALLTGDRAAPAHRLARKVHIKEVHPELLPIDKARWIESRQAEGRRVAMVGDGMNDAPALARADAGIAVGGPGSDLAAEAGDMVLLAPRLDVLPDVVRLSRATLNAIRVNILAFAFGLNALAMLAATLGWLDPVAAAILHQIGSLLVLLNALRLLAYRDWARLAPIAWLKGLSERTGRLDERFDLADLGRWGWRHRRMLGALGLLGLLAIPLGSCLVAIAPDEVGVVRRLGRVVDLVGPGLHVRWPLPIETLDRVRPGRLRAVAVGLRSSLDPGAAAPVGWSSSHGRSVSSDDADEALVMTGDERFAEVSAVVHFRMRPDRESILNYAIYSANVDQSMRAAAESAVRSVVGRAVLDDLLTTDRPAAEARVARRIQERADAARLGVAVERVVLQDLHPPPVVLDAYRDVSRARADAEARRIAAHTYDDVSRIEGEAEAAVRIDAGRTDRAISARRAAGLAAAFLARLAADRDAPRLARHRLFWDRIEADVAGRPKLVLDAEPGAPRRRLLLPGARVDFSDLLRNTLPWLDANP